MKKKLKIVILILGICLVLQSLNNISFADGMGDLPGWRNDLDNLENRK